LPNALGIDASIATRRKAFLTFLIEVDHTLPLAKGRLDEETNRALACRACNLHKSDATGGFDPVLFGRRQRSTNRKG